MCINNTPCATEVITPEFIWQVCILIVVGTTHVYCERATATADVAITAAKSRHVNTIRSSAIGSIDCGEHVIRNHLTASRQRVN